MTTYQEYQDKLEQLNKSINKIMYLKQNWDNKELMQKCIDMQAEVKNIEHTMLNLELQPEKEEYPILIELHKPKKIWYERKGFILNENLNEGHDFENFNGKVLTY